MGEVSPAVRVGGSNPGTTMRDVFVVLGVVRTRPEALERVWQLGSPRFRSPSANDPIHYPTASAKSH